MLGRWDAGAPEVSPCPGFWDLSRANAWNAASAFADVMLKENKKKVLLFYKHLPDYPGFK